MRKPTKLGYALMLTLVLALLPAMVNRAESNGVWNPPDITWWQEYVEMSDGTLLDTRIIRPDDNRSTPWQTIILRTPYLIGPPDEFPELRDFFPHQYGYCYVVQNTCGRRASEGVDRIFYDEMNDGYDIVEWVAAQNWSDGKIGVHGGSASAVMAYLATASQPPSLDASYALIGSANVYNDAMFEGGALRYGDIFMWTLGMISGLSDEHIEETVIPEEQQYVEGWQAVCNGIRWHMWGHLETEYPNRPVDSEWFMNLTLIGFYEGFSKLYPQLDTILSHPSEDAFRNYLDVAGNIESPMLHIGGWYDFFGIGTMEAWKTLQSREDQKLIMTGGTHKDLDLDYSRFYDWFDYWLKHEATGIMDEDPIHYYNIGADVWYDVEEWLPEGTGHMIGYLHADGKIDTTAPTVADDVNTFIYDPTYPVITWGGRNLDIPSGGLDQTEVEDGRDDIMAYESNTLTFDLNVMGNVKTVLHVSSNATDTDFTVKLIDIYPNGSHILVLDSILRMRYRDSFANPTLMTPGTVYNITLNLGDISYLFKTGHKLRISVSSSNFPQYDRNLNTGGQLYNETSYNVASNTIYHNSTFPSYVWLPTRWITAPNDQIDHWFTPNPGIVDENIVLDGLLLDGYDDPIPYVDVVIYYCYDNSSWVYWTTLETNSTGYFTKTFTVDWSTTYYTRAIYQSTHSYETLVVNP